MKIIIKYFSNDLKMYVHIPLCRIFIACQQIFLELKCNIL